MLWQSGKNKNKEFEKIAYLPKYEEKKAEYIAKMKNAGLEKVVAEVQKQLNAWKTANGK